MKFVILGDVHGRFSSIWTAYEREKPDAILQVGDLAAQEYAERRLDVGVYPDALPPVPFVWILGNHENLKIFGTVGKALGFFGAHDIGGIRIIGLGGVQGAKRPTHWGVNHALDNVRPISRADILLTHETCSPFLDSRSGKDLGSSELAAECARLAPKVHFSGHHHHANLEKINDVVHYRLPYAWDGYAVYEEGLVSLIAIETSKATPGSPA